MVIETDFYYDPADSFRRLHIWLPDDYDVSQERYPVMYFFDGHNLFYDSVATYGTCWGLREYMDSWPKKVIIVGMECSHEGNHRLYEYSPYRMHFRKETIDGIGEETFRWLIHSVKPYIDRTYRTYGHREATGLGGSSMGGIMSLYGVMAHNDVFSKAACCSAGMFYNLNRYRMTLAASSLHPDTRVFLSWSESEDRAPRGQDPATRSRTAYATFRFEKELQAYGVQTYHYFGRGCGHNEAAWAQQVPVFMPWLWLGSDH